jgi:hypothetical protein
MFHDNQRALGSEYPLDVVCDRYETDPLVPCLSCRAHLRLPPARILAAIEMQGNSLNAGGVVLFVV